MWVRYSLEKYSHGAKSFSKAGRDPQWLGKNGPCADCDRKEAKRANRHNRSGPTSLRGQSISENTRWACQDTVIEEMVRRSSRPGYAGTSEGQTVAASLALLNFRAIQTAHPLIRQAGRANRPGLLNNHHDVVSLLPIKRYYCSVWAAQIAATSSALRP